MNSLFNPLIKARQFYILEYIQSEMELKLHEAELKNKDADYSEHKKKIELVKDAKCFIYEIWEEGYILQNRSLALEGKLIDLEIENQTLKKEIETLKENIIL